jgi:hypothetical protein
MLSEELCLARRGRTFCPARARPSWIIRGACPLHDLDEVGTREKEKTRRTQKCDRHFARRHTPCECDRHYFLPSFLSFPCALELLSVELCLTRRGWTFCLARARPSWIIRGACPLHDPEGVRKCEENGKKKYQEETEEASYKCNRDCVSAMTLSHPYLSTPPSLVLWNC